MPATYEIDKRRRLVITTALEQFAVADGLAHQERLLKDPDFDPTFSQIMDVTRIDFSGVTADDIRKLAERNVFSPGSRRAIVVSSTFVYGFGRMFEMLRENAGESGIRIFRDMDDAIDWILSESATA